jgi:hypothetical protein
MNFNNPVINNLVSENVKMIRDKWINLHDVGYK